MRYYISSNFKNLSKNWVKYLFHLEKWNFEPTGNFAYNIGFLTLRKALLILLPLYLQILIMQISTQTDNLSTEKMLQLKKQVWNLKKWIKVLKPKHFMQNSINFFNKIATVWSSKVNKAILEQGEVAE